MQRVRPERRTAGGGKATARKGESALRPPNGVPQDEICNCTTLAMGNTGMTLNRNEYRKQLADGVKEFGQFSPGSVKGYVELSAAGQKADLLGAKVRNWSHSPLP